MTTRHIAQSRKQGEQPVSHSGSGNFMRSIADSVVPYLFLSERNVN